MNKQSTITHTNLDRNKTLKSTTNNLYKYKMASYKPAILNKKLILQRNYFPNINSFFKKNINKKMVRGDTKLWRESQKNQSNNRRMVREGTNQGGESKESVLIME